MKLDGNGRFSKVMLSEVVRELMRREWVNHSPHLLNHLESIHLSESGQKISGNCTKTTSGKKYPGGKGYVLGRVLMQHRTPNSPCGTDFTLTSADLHFCSLTPSTSLCGFKYVPLNPSPLLHFHRYHLSPSYYHLSPAAFLASSLTPS